MTPEVGGLIYSDGQRRVSVQTEANMIEREVRLAARLAVANPWSFRQFVDGVLAGSEQEVLSLIDCDVLIAPFLHDHPISSMIPLRFT